MNKINCKAIQIEERFEILGQPTRMQANFLIASPSRGGILFSERANIGLPQYDCGSVEDLISAQEAATGVFAFINQLGSIKVKDSFPIQHGNIVYGKDKYVYQLQATQLCHQPASGRQLPFISFFERRQ